MKNCLYFLVIFQVCECDLEDDIKMRGREDWQNHKSALNTFIKEQLKVRLHTSCLTNPCTVLPTNISPNRGAITSQTTAPDQSPQRYVQLIFRQTLCFSWSKQGQKQPNSAVQPWCWQHCPCMHTQCAIGFIMQQQNHTITPKPFLDQKLGMLYLSE